MKKTVIILSLLIPSLCAAALKGNLPAPAKKVLPATIAASKIAVGGALAAKGTKILDYLVASVTNASLAKDFSTPSAYLFHTGLLVGGAYLLIDGVRSLRNL